MEENPTTLTDDQIVTILRNPPISAKTMQSSKNQSAGGMGPKDADGGDADGTDGDGGDSGDSDGKDGGGDMGDADMGDSDSSAGDSDGKDVG